MAETNLNVRFKHCLKTTEDWASCTIVPYLGELCIEDTGSEYKAKFGNGVDTFANLRYITDNNFTNVLLAKLEGIEDGANKTIIDSELSSTSVNPVQNKVVDTAIQSLNILTSELKSKLFVGTYEEYEVADSKGLVALNALVIIIDKEDNDDGGNTDDEENTESTTTTTAKLGYAKLGYMKLGEE